MLLPLIFRRPPYATGSLPGPVAVGPMWAGQHAAISPSPIDARGRRGRATSRQIFRRQHFLSPPFNPYYAMPPCHADTPSGRAFARPSCCGAAGAARRGAAMRCHLFPAITPFSLRHLRRRAAAKGHYAFAIFAIFFRRR